MDLFTFPSGPCGGSAVQTAGDAALILLQLLLLPLLRSAHLVYSLTHRRHVRTKAACGPITELAGTKDCTNKTDFLLPLTYFPFLTKLIGLLGSKCPLFYFTVLYWPRISKSRWVAWHCCSWLQINKKKRCCFGLAIKTSVMFQIMWNYLYHAGWC